MSNVDPFDAALDARSAARYDDDPQAEPDLEEVKSYAGMADDSALAESDKFIGGKR